MFHLHSLVSPIKLLMRSLSIVNICSNNTTAGRLNAGFLSMRTWVGWFGFLETFEVTAATITVGANLFSVLFLVIITGRLLSLLGAIVRVKVCKIDFATAKTKVSRHINDSGHPPLSLCRQKPPCGRLLRRFRTVAIGENITA